jgi:hypothetical protein
MPGFQGGLELQIFRLAVWAARFVVNEALIFKSESFVKLSRNSLICRHRDV